MTLEQAAIAALLFMVSFCGVLLKILWDRSNACEKHNDTMHATLENQANKIGVLEGQLGVMQRCAVPNCPYRSHALPKK
jgi:hypothetical protein